LANPIAHAINSSSNTLNNTMQRDWDLIRQILLTVENAEANVKVSFEDILDCTEETFRYNTVLLREAGLIHALVLPNIKTIMVESLTWEGHEFLDSFRNDASWEYIKTIAAEKSLGLSFASIKAIEHHLRNKIIAAL
jgi:hypothetical protein